MKFRIPVQELQWAVALLGVTAKMNTVEVAGRILIEATEDAVSFVSNNSSTALSLSTRNVSVEETGIVSVAFSTMKSFVSPFSPWDDKNEVGAKDFLFKSDTNGLRISVRNKYASGRVANGRVRLDVYNAASITPPSNFDTPTFTLNSDALKAAIGKVSYAIDPTCVSQMLRGLCIRFTEDKICFAGTDGKTLSEFAIENTSDIKDATFVIKMDFIMGLRRLLVPDIELEFMVQDRDVKMRFDSILFSGKTIIGNEYPQYEFMFSDYDQEVIIEKEVLTSNLRPFVDVLDQGDFSRVFMQIENKKIMLYNDSGQFVCDCDFTFEGERLIEINGVLLLSAIEAINDAKISIKFSSDTSKAILFDSASYPGNQRALIVPLRARS